MKGLLLYFWNNFIFRNKLIYFRILFFKVSIYKEIVIVVGVIIIRFLLRVNIVLFGLIN